MQRMRSRFIVGILLGALVLTGCSAGGAEEQIVTEYLEAIAALDHEAADALVDQPPTASARLAEAASGIDGIRVGRAADPDWQAQAIEQGEAAMVPVAYTIAGEEHAAMIAVIREDAGLIISSAGSTPFPAVLGFLEGAPTLYPAEYRPTVGMTPLLALLQDGVETDAWRFGFSDQRISVGIALSEQGSQSVAAEGGGLLAPAVAYLDGCELVEGAARALVAGTEVICAEATAIGGGMSGALRELSIGECAPRPLIVSVVDRAVLLNASCDYTWRAQYSFMGSSRQVGGVGIIEVLYGLDPATGAVEQRSISVLRG